MRISKILVLAVIVICLPGVCRAEQCKRPDQPDFNSEQFKALYKKSAYAAFLSDSCGLDSAIEQRADILMKTVFPESIDDQSNARENFSNWKRGFSDSVGLVGRAKSCFLNSNETRDYINKVAESIIERISSISEERKKFNSNMSIWNDCLRVQREQEEAAARRAKEQAVAVKAIDDVEVAFRKSLMDNGTYVMRMRNPSSMRVSFRLKCYTVNGASKLFQIDIGAWGEYELGFLEGWQGNFVHGEYCVASYMGEDRWQVKI